MSGKRTKRLKRTFLAMTALKAIPRAKFKTISSSEKPRSIKVDKEVIQVSPVITRDVEVVEKSVWRMLKKEYRNA